MVGTTGFEPATFRAQGERSSQAELRSVNYALIRSVTFAGSPQLYLLAILSTASVALAIEEPNEDMLSKYALTAANLP
jgi:hypothetical protein